MGDAAMDGNLHTAIVPYFTNGLCVSHCDYHTAQEGAWRVQITYRCLPGDVPSVALSPLEPLIGATEASVLTDHRLARHT